MDKQLTVQKLNNLSQRVEFVLGRYPETRNSDLELQAQVYIQFYPPFETAIYNWQDFVSVMRSLPTLDHIARSRRKVIQSHEYKKYLPTILEVAINRGYAEEIWREYAKQEKIPTPEQIQTQLITGDKNIPQDHKKAYHEDTL